MRKRYPFFVFCLILLVSLCACSKGNDNEEDTKEDVETANNSNTDDNNTTEADYDAYETILTDIYYAAPGTAGCSLKAAKTAGELLDWLYENASSIEKDTLQQKTSDWYTSNKDTLYEIDCMRDAADFVITVADDILTDSDQFKGMLDDSGYELKHRSYNKDYLSLVEDVFHDVFLPTDK